MFCLFTILLLNDEESSNGPQFDLSPPPSDSSPPILSFEDPSLLTISLPTLTGSLHPSTFRFTGYITGLPSQIFIEPFTGFSIMVGNGQGLVCFGVIIGVPITI